VGPLHRRWRRDPTHASRYVQLAQHRLWILQWRRQCWTKAATRWVNFRWEAEPEAAAGAGVRGEGGRLQRVGAHVLRHPSQLHAPLWRRVRRQGILLILIPPTSQQLSIHSS
jgi:hypothetical protein